MDTFLLLNQLADLADNQTLPLFRSNLEVSNKSSQASFDPVTEADRRAESSIRDYLEKVCPDDGIWGEEYGIKTGKNNITWVLDPVDGTRAYVVGVPVWTTLIGRMDGIKVTAGIVSQPFIGERFIAWEEKSIHVHRNGSKSNLRVRACQSLSDAMLVSTSPFIYSQAIQDKMSKIYSKVRDTRFGTDSYGFAMIAAGCADLVVDEGLANYDVAAIIPLIEYAGGIITDWQGARPEKGGQIIAAGDRRVHQQCMDILNQ